MRRPSYTYTAIPSGSISLSENQGRLFGFVGVVTGAASGLVRSLSTENHEVVRSNNPLSEEARAAAAMADRQHLGDELGSATQSRNRLEGSPQIVGVESGNDDLLARIGQPLDNCNETIIEELAFVNADHDCDVLNGSQQLL